jgi:transposase
MSRRNHLSLDAKQVVKNVYETLISRGLIKQEALKETCLLTKTPISSIRDIIISEELNKRKKRSDFQSHRIDNSDQDLIRRKIYCLYESGVVPTLDKLKKKLDEDETNINISRATLHRVVCKMGFKYRKIDKRQVVMESHRLRTWRFNYLQEIKRYRLENRSIIYLDETWFDTHDTVSKGWVDSSQNCQTKAPSNKGKRITIIHAGSEDGFVPNCLLLSAKNIKDSSLDYHEDTSAELFENWFQNYLLKNIPNNSVIVMDNASYHSRLLHKAPASSSSKTEIQEYLLENDIYFEFSYKKAQLLEVLNSYAIKKQYVCDNLAEQAGHTVLRLPPYHCMFNPIEHLWNQVKSKIRAENVTPTLSPSVINLIKNVITNIPVESWKNSVQHIIKIEDSYISIQNNINPIVINLNDDSDSETELDLDI